METNSVSRDDDDALDGGEASGRDLDPEYQDLLSQQNKQQRLLEHGGKFGIYYYHMNNLYMPKLQSGKGFQKLTALYTRLKQ